MKIAAFEGFYGGSHKSWLDGFVKHTSHEVRVFQLPDRFWKWRMHGGAVTLANQFNKSDFEPDCLLVTDMLDLNVLLSLTRKRTAHIPVVFFFHENQINYPWSEQDRDIKYERNHHYGFINYASALTAELVLFNSEYHKSALIGALPRFLKMFPDYQNAATVELIDNKSQVLPLGVDLLVFDQYVTEVQKEVPVILWNHRWEFDKNPEVFFNVLLRLSKNDVDFKLIVCGDRTEKYPKVFDEIRASLEKHVIHWGFAENFEDYARLLFQSDILPVTSNQDFFGISTVEAMYCNVYPLLPNRLAFPEHIPDLYKNAHLYNTEEQLYDKLKTLLQDGVPIHNSKDWVGRYDWSELIPRYDQIFMSQAR